MIKIAISEDDFRVAMIHEGFLEKLNEVELVGKAINSEETLALLAEKEVDLLLLDVYLPDRLGIDLMKQIRLDFPQVDIVMITASANTDIVEQSIRNGVVDYIIKPVTFERFKTTIENYLEKKNLLEGNKEVTQELVDQFFSIKHDPKEKKAHTPKGIDPLTFEKVKAIMLENKQEGITAEEMGERMGASRTTARRYLEYLISIGEGKAELSYGIVGRPERKYFLS